MQHLNHEVRMNWGWVLLAYILSVDKKNPTIPFIEFTFNICYCTVLVA